MKDYVIELMRLGYEDTVLEFAKKANLSQIESLIEQSFCSNLLKQALKNLVRKRHAELINGI